ncbi:MAG: putative toxin-antitoxin system toxin component, PIN family [Bacteroidota bacterium]
MSAFILPHSVARKALNLARKLGMVIISDFTANEFTDVFVRTKFDKYLSLELRLEIIDDFKSLVILANPTVEISDCRDPKDNKFLELAVSESAECIITGDQDLLVLHPFRHIPILTATEFLSSYDKESVFLVNEPATEYRTTNL